MTYTQQSTHPIVTQRTRTHQPSTTMQPAFAQPTHASSSHPNPEQIPQPQLRHIIGDILVMLQIAIRIRSLVRPDALVRIRLQYTQLSSAQTQFDSSSRR